MALNTGNAYVSYSDDYNGHELQATATSLYMLNSATSGSTSFSINQGD
jgi:hypothetical protein